LQSLARKRKQRHTREKDSRSHRSASTASSIIHAQNQKQTGWKKKKKRGTEIMETAAQTQDAPSTSKRYTTHRVTKTRNDIQTQSILSKSKNEKEQNGA